MFRGESNCPCRFQLFQLFHFLKFVWKDVNLHKYWHSSDDTLRLVVAIFLDCNGKWRVFVNYSGFDDLAKLINF